MQCGFLYKLAFLGSFKDDGLFRNCCGNIISKCVFKVEQAGDELKPLLAPAGPSQQAALQRAAQEPSNIKEVAKSVCFANIYVFVLFFLMNK
jgi:hypothetical protein